MLLCAPILAALALAPVAQAGTREPLALAFAALHQSGPPLDAAAQPEAKALKAAQRGRWDRPEVGPYEAKISSTYYGPEQMDSIRRALDRLDHGPEMAQLSVYVATPGEIEEICGATVVACYVPSQMEMVVSGVDRPVAGVPRDFAIAHEYGHHLANTQHGEFLPAIETGTIRWATYERVCQFTRSHHLFPGNQGARYWEDPEEAFAESYAHLSDPQDAVSWQFTPLLRPTSASLAKIQADLDHPWRGPVTTAFGGSAAEPRTFSRLVRTPLDGRVSVSIQASTGADLSVSLRDPEGGPALARAATGEGGSAELSYANCGHASLRLEVQSLGGSGAFTATVVRP